MEDSFINNSRGSIFKRLDASMSSSHDLNSPSKSDHDGKLSTEEKKPAHGGQFLNVANNPTTVNLNRNKPRGSFNYGNMGRGIIVDRMDSLKSMKSGGYVDPFMRTNQALLKRLDSIGSVFNKSANLAHGNFALNKDNYQRMPSGISTLSKRLKHQDTPIFQGDVPVYDIQQNTSLDNSKLSTPGQETVKDPSSVTPTPKYEMRLSERFMYPPMLGKDNF